MNHHILRFALALLATACGADKSKQSAEPSSVFDELRVEYQKGLEAYEAVTAERDGRASDTDCDSALWSALALFAGAGVDLSPLEYYPGEWHRRPAPSCWNATDGDVGSKSTISRDMLQGLLLATWETGDVQTALRLAKYGEDRQWVMGEPYPEMASRVEMGDNLKGQLGRIIYKLTDERDSRDYRKIKPLYGPVLQDYERHIQAIGIYLYGELDQNLTTTLQMLGSQQSANSADFPEEQGFFSPQRESDANYIGYPRPIQFLSTDVSPTMFTLLQISHKRDPGDAFIGAIYQIYAGDLQKPARQLLNPDYKCPSYVRAKGDKTTALYCDIHKLAGMKVILKHVYGRDLQ